MINIKMGFEMHSDERFEYLLNKILCGEISKEDDKFEEFNENYIWLDSVGEKGVPQIKLAAERGYKPAYYHLAQSYLNGIGNNKNPELGIEWLRKSVTANEQGACILGDCYRLGTGVEKNYDMAWMYYQKAVENWDERGEHPEPKELLLQIRDDECFDFMETAGVDVSWWEYAVTKKSSPQIIAQMPGLYSEESELYWYWVHKAADSEIMWAKYLWAEKLLKDKDHPDYIGLAVKLLTAVSFSDDQSSVDAALILLKMDLDFELKKQLACNLYQNGDEGWKIMLDLYKDNQDQLASLLIDCDEIYESGDIPDNMFRCSCCHRLLRFDDQNDPDAQGDYCDDCYYSGKILENGNENEED